MERFTIDRRNDGFLYLIFRTSVEIGGQEDTASTSVEKVLGYSQGRQIIDLIRRHLQPEESFIEPGDRTFVDNDEYQIVYIQEDLYRMSLRISDTSFLRIDFNKLGLQNFFDKLNELLNDDRPELGGIELPNNEGNVQPGPTGPTGPTGPAGPAGEDLNNYQTIRKTEDQSVSDDTLVDDNELLIDVSENEAIVIEYAIFDDSTPDNDLKFEVLCPDESTGQLSFLYAEGSSVAQAQFDVGDSVTVAVATSVPGLLRIYGQINVGLSGQIKLRWAKGTAAGSDLAFKSGSYVNVSRI